MINKSTVFVGTELKLNVHVEPIGEITMDDYDFEVEVYCLTKRSIVIPKSSAVRVDSDNYLVLVDTDKVGAGDLRCKVTAYIPDADFPDGLRTEIAIINTGITISKTR